MLTDRYGLLLSTTSPAARDAYRRGLRGEADDVPRRDRGVRSCHRRRSRLCPRPCRQGARAAGARGRGGGTRVDGGGQFLRRRSVRAGSQPYRIFRLAGGGRGRSRTFRIDRAPERLAARCRRARHHRVHQWPDRQFRPRRAETRAAGPAGTALPRATATIGGSRPIMGWRSRRMDSERPPGQRSNDPSPKTPRTPGRRMPARTSPMKRAIQTRPAPSWRPGSRPTRATARYIAT